MSEWRPQCPCTVDCIAADPAPQVWPVLRWMRLAGVIGLLVVTFAVTPVLKRVSQPAWRRFARSWNRALLRAFGATVVVSGDVADRPFGPTGRGVLVVSNHTSLLDVFVIGTLQPTRTVAKREMSRFSRVSAVPGRLEPLLVSRDLNGLAEIRSQVAGALAGGDQVLVFPEGTSSCGESVGTFRPALFQAAIDAGVPVRAVAVRYRLREGRRTPVAGAVLGDSLPASIRRIAATRGLVIELTLLPEMDPGQDRRALARAAEEAVRAKITPTLAPV